MISFLLAALCEHGLWRRFEGGARRIVGERGIWRAGWGGREKFEALFGADFLDGIMGGVGQLWG